MYVNKWASFSASILLAVAGGSGYCWPLISPAVKRAFEYNQLQLETVANPLLPQFLVSWLPGLGVSMLCKHERLGGRLALLIGITLGLGGNMIFVLAAKGKFGHLHLWQVVWLGVLASMGNVWFDVASITTSIANFPQHRGTAVGILKAVYGISASMFATVWATFFEPDGLSFMLFIAITCAILASIAVPFFNIVPFRQAQEQPGHRFIMVYLMLAAIALYQPAATLIQSLVSDTPLTRMSVAAGIIVTLLPTAFIPWGTGGLFARPMITVPVSPTSASRTLLMNTDPEDPLPVAYQGSVIIKAASPPHADALHDLDELNHEKFIDARLPLGIHPSDEGAPRCAEDDIFESEGVCSLRCHLMRSDDIITAAHEDREWASVQPKDGREGSPRPGLAAALEPLLVPEAEQQTAYEEPLSLLQSLSSINFWLLFVIFGSGTGCGLLLLLNLGQLVESLGGQANGQNMLLTLFSIFNSVGRVAAGWLPEHMLHKRGTPRTLWLLVIAAGSTVATALAGVAGGLGSLQAAAPLAGAVYGAHQAIMPVLASELFDLQRFATLYVILQQATLLGSYGLSTRLAGALYDQKAEQQKMPNICLGPDCFREAFLIAAALQMLATVLAGILYYRTQNMYHTRALEVHSADLVEAEACTSLPQASPARM